MKQTIRLGIASAAIPVALLVTEVRAQIDQPVAPYNPYPSGILPANLQSELERVKREVQTIFDRYFAEWQALTPPVLSNTQGEGNPPILQGTG